MRKPQNAAQLANLRPKPVIDLSGVRFGRLVVIADTGERRGPQPVWSWVCDCGNTGTSQGRHLRNGGTTSCGCVRREMAAAKAAAMAGVYVTDTPRYCSAHNRVSAAKGRATLHPCADCGGEAQDWSYTHTDPSELTDTVDGYDVNYSADPAFYVPRCKSCHRRFDVAIRGTVAAN